MPAPAVQTSADTAAIKETVTRIYYAYQALRQKQAVKPEHFYSPAFRQLGTTAVALAARAGEEAYVDGDEFCQCQDWDADKFKLLSTDVSYSDGTHAKARVSFIRFAEETPLWVDLMFVRGKPGWQIDDIVALDDRGRMRSVATGYRTDISAFRRRLPKGRR
jgi:hypothetical protein